MRNLHRILIILTLLFLGCESVITNTDLDYVEKIIINGRITAGEKIENIAVRKTISPNESWAVENSDISDAEVILSCDNIDYKLDYIGKGLYSCDLIAESEKNYHLSVRWNEKHCYADTFIPEDFEIHSPIVRVGKIYKWMIWESKQLYLNVSPIKNAAYMVAYKTDWNDELQRYFSRKVQQSENVSDNGFVEVFVKYIYGDELLDEIEGVVEAYDEKFKDIIETFNNSNNDSNIISTSGYEVRWNVKGDGIGMFIGLNKKKFILKDMKVKVE